MAAQTTAEPSTSDASADSDGTRDHHGRRHDGLRNARHCALLAPNETETAACEPRNEHHISYAISWWSQHRSSNHVAASPSSLPVSYQTQARSAFCH